MSGPLFVVALLAVVVAIVFYVQARSNGAALLQLRKEQDDLKKAGEGDRTKVKELEGELKTKGQHLVEAREKLADARKKGSEPKSQKQQSRGTREAELEEDLKNARDLTLEAHAAETKARKDAFQAKTEAAAARAELGAAQAKVRELAEKAGLVKSTAPASPAAPYVVSDAVLTEKLGRSEAELKKAAAEVVDLRTALQAAKDKELGLKDELRRAKGRVETHNRVYLVTKGETELLKERIAQAERLLWKAGIVVPKPEPKERPKATGPLAADRPRVEKAEEAAPAAPVQALPEPQPEKHETVAVKSGTSSAGVEAVLASQGGGAVAAAISAGLQASPPLRRKGKADEPLRN
jgi:predicted  nucleic acid-binding Zn-ribbon protein